MKALSVTGDAEDLLRSDVAARTRRVLTSKTAYRYKCIVLLTYILPLIKGLAVLKSLHIVSGSLSESLLLTLLIIHVEMR